MLLFLAVSSRTLLQAQFKDQRCSSTPVSIIQYTNETLPPMVKQFSPLYLEDTKRCGKLFPAVQMNDACCYSPTTTGDMTFPGQVPSGYAVQLDDSKPVESQVPLSASGKSFCKISANGAKSNMGYVSFYILASSDCVYDTNVSFTCSKTGELTIYPSSVSCNSTFGEKLMLSEQTMAFSSSNLGNIAASLVYIQKGSTRAGWVANLPAILATTGNSPTELVGLLCQLLAFIATLSTFAIACYICYKRRRPLNYQLAITQLFWAMEISIRLYITYIPNRDLSLAFQNHFFNAIITFDIIYGMATLSTALYTATFLILFVKMRRLAAIALYSAIIFIHFDLGGALYLQIYYILNPTLNPSDFYFFWSQKVWSLWILLLMIWDLIPIALIMNMLLKLTNFTWKQKLKCLFKADPFFYAMVIIDFLSITGFISLVYIINFTTVLGGDRDASVATGLATTCIAIHNLCTVYLNFSIKKVKDYQAELISSGKFTA